MTGCERLLGEWSTKDRLAYLAGIGCFGFTGATAQSFEQNMPELGSSKHYIETTAVLLGMALLSSYIKFWMMETSYSLDQTVGEKSTTIKTRYHPLWIPLQITWSRRRLLGWPLIETQGKGIMNMAWGGSYYYGLQNIVSITIQRQPRQIESRFIKTVSAAIRCHAVLWPLQLKEDHSRNNFNWA